MIFASGLIDNNDNDGNYELLSLCQRNVSKVEALTRPWFELDGISLQKSFIIDQTKPCLSY